MSCPHLLKPSKVVCISAGEGLNCAGMTAECTIPTRTLDGCFPDEAGFEKRLPIFRRCHYERLQPGHPVFPQFRKENAMDFLWFLIVGLIAGWLAGMLVKGGGFGLIGDLVVGVIGAFIGGYLFSLFGASAGGGLIGSIVVATVGAVLLLIIVRAIKRKK
jgi:uncharacterized membrane protein YeaQ/YmgE (transglycosylase-associated protein family)